MLSIADNSEEVPELQSQHCCWLYIFFFLNGIVLAEPSVQIHARGCWLFLQAKRASMSQHHRGKTGSHALIKNFPYIYNCNKPWTEPAIPRVDDAPHGVETPTPTAS